MVLHRHRVWRFGLITNSFYPLWCSFAVLGLNYVDWHIIFFTHVKRWWSHVCCRYTGHVVPFKVKVLLHCTHCRHVCLFWGWTDLDLLYWYLGISTTATFMEGTRVFLWGIQPWQKHIGLCPVRWARDPREPSQPSLRLSKWMVVLFWRLWILESKEDVEGERIFCEYYVDCHIISIGRTKIH